MNLSLRTVQRWRKAPELGDQRRGPHTKVNAFSTQERQEILERINQPDYADLCPAQIVCQAADKGDFIASESTMYRILNEAKQNKRRGREACAKKRIKPEYVAKAPNQVWVWDITYLPLSVRGHYAYLYLFMDLFSRKIVGWKICESESMEESSRLMAGLAVELGVAGTGLTLHSDNGGPMKGSTMVRTLQTLGIHQSLSRPGVSNDNAYCESSIRTIKYRPGYPERLENIEEWTKWFESFVEWYNYKHMHSGIGYTTPEQRYTGDDVWILENRRKVYAEAKRKNPSRWSREARAWSRPTEVRLAS